MSTEITDAVNNVLTILEDVGIPMDGLTDRRKTRMAKAILALCDYQLNTSWTRFKSIDENHAYGSREIIAHINAHLNESMSSGSYDDIRRKDLILPVEAGLVIKAAGKSTANTNDGTRRYAMTAAVIEVFRAFQTENYPDRLKQYLTEHVSLKEQMDREREMALIPVTLQTGETMRFSQGAHNQLQKAIIEDFLPRYGHGAELLYVGDSTDKYLYLNQEKLTELGFFELAHDKLPDVVAYSTSKKWLYLIEAVHTSNPISELRKRVLDELTADLKIGIVYVTAFNTRDVFRRFSKDIAWETEAWIADNPTHLIHFNGDKFLGPYQPPQ